MSITLVLQASINTAILFHDWYYTATLSRTYHAYSIDATEESGRLGRLVNHSKKGNCVTKQVTVEGVPRLVIMASRDIHVGDEILYDYGDHSKASIQAHPWLKK